MSIFRLAINCCLISLGKLSAFRKHISHPGDFKIRGFATIYNNGNFQCGHDVIVNSSRIANLSSLSSQTTIIVDSGASLSIGDHTGISNSVIYCRNRIQIGSYVNIGSDCKIFDNDFHSLNHLERRNRDDINIPSRPIQIGDDVFIGSASIILKGVHIGDGAIIAAGSVLSKSVPSRELWGGNPARKIRSLEAGSTSSL